MKRKFEYLCPVAFCIVVLLTSFCFFFSGNRTYSEKEKRFLEQGDGLTVSGVLDGSTQKRFEAWIEDQFPARDAYVALNAYSMLISGRNGLQNIYFADNGYLVNAPASNNTVQFEKNISRFEQFAESVQIPCSMILVPSTGYLQQESLPITSKAYPDEKCLQIASKLSALKFYNYVDVLKSADAENNVAYRTDHHLSSWGNYVLYQQWCRDQGIVARAASEYSIEKISGFYGTTWSGSGYWLTKPDMIELWNNGLDVSVTITDGGEDPVLSDDMFFRKHLEELDKYPVFLDGNHCRVDIENAGAPDRTILLIKDSYAHCFANFLTEHYNRIIMLDLRYYRGSISDFIENNDVDEVLFFYGISTLLTDTNSAWLF